MRKLTFNEIEELFFKNAEAKELLWKDFNQYYKEYNFLVKTGIDRSLLNRLFIRFIEKISKKEHEKIYFTILGKISRDKILYYTITLTYNLLISINNLLTDFTRPSVNINKQLLDLNSKTINTRYKLKSSGYLILTDNNTRNYPNLSCSRTKDLVKLTFWR